MVDNNWFMTNQESGITTDMYIWLERPECAGLESVEKKAIRES